MSCHIAQISASDTWPLRHKVMWPDKPLDYIKLPEDEQGLHYGLFVSEQLVSVISLFIKDDTAQFRKFATDQSKQGNGYGSKLLQYLIEDAKSKDIQKIWCNARVDKTNFYERFGMVKTDRSFQKGGIDYAIMELI